MGRELAPRSEAESDYPPEEGAADDWPDRNKPLCEMGEEELAATLLRMRSETYNEAINGPYGMHGRRCDGIRY